MLKKEEQILQQPTEPCNGPKCCIGTTYCPYQCYKDGTRCCTPEDLPSDCSVGQCVMCPVVECTIPNECVPPESVCDPETNTCCLGADATCCASTDSCCPEGKLCVDPGEVCEGSCCDEGSSCISDIDIPVPCVQPVPCTVVCKNVSETDPKNSITITILASHILGLNLAYQVTDGPFKGTLVKGTSPNDNQFTYTPNDGALGFDHFTVNVVTLDNNGKEINSTCITVSIRIDACLPPPPCNLNCACCGPEQDCTCVCASDNAQ